MSFPSYISIGNSAGPGFTGPGLHRSTHPGIFGKSQTAGKNYKLPTCGIDPDAAAYLTAAFYTQTDVGSGVTVREQNWLPVVFWAIDRAVKDLKDAGIWSLCRAIYPMCCGMHHPSNSFATFADAWNLKDPRDAAAAFPNNYNSVISTELGDRVAAAGNAGDTLILATTLSKTSWHLAAYISANPTSNQAVIGAGLNSTFGIQVTTTRITCVGNNSSGVSVATGTINGFIIGTRRSSTDLTVFRKGELLATDTTSGTGNFPASSDIFTFFGYDASTAYTTGWMRWASVGDGLTDDQAVRYSQIVQDFNTRLGRSV